ncbi:MAG: hypothetical protein KDD69_15875 [Bdellovibrionales bacterium]|nr:hypothetical protein [Bdellovibrionales bacterium]
MGSLFRRGLVAVFVLSSFLVESSIRPDGSLLSTLLCLPFTVLERLVPSHISLTWVFAAGAVLLYTYEQLMSLMPEHIAELRKELQRKEKRAARRHAKAAPE